MTGMERGYVYTGILVVVFLAVTFTLFLLGII